MTTIDTGRLDPGNLNATDGTSVLSSKRAAYGDNPFLQLLTEQLRNQTPLEPVDNQSFMNQMASYTTMQEQRDLNTNLLKLLDYQGLLARVQGLSQGSSLLGKDVSYAGDNGQAVHGKVESVFVAETGDVKLRLEGGREIELRQVLGISEAGSTTNGSTTNGSSGEASTSSGSSASGTSGSTAGSSGSSASNSAA